MNKLEIKVFKKYLVIVDGKLESANGVLENYLLKNEKKII